jgi:D-alanyl-D-alanine carboxypeptidase
MTRVSSAGSGGSRRSGARGAGVRAGLRAAVLAAAAALPPAAPLAAQPLPDAARVRAAVDSIAAEALKDGRVAGLAVAVVRGPDTLVLKGYGYADLEWRVPMSPDAVMEIGSVTKQFTAAALLKLQRQGRLSLEDDLRRYLPDYDTRGHVITLHQLLDHRSGIKGYTELPEFRGLMARRAGRDSLVALFASKPFDFAPGEALVYNNSAYFLAGLVIEKVTGESYAQYVERELMAPAGMRASRYCDSDVIIERRARGYQFAQDGLRRAQVMDHTYPYAAGSLCSTAGDLVAWLQALHGGRVLHADDYRAMITPATLNDGTPLRYAMGLATGEAAGRPVISHGGGIDGFLSETMYFPDTRTIVVVLANTAGPVSPSALATAMAEAAQGRVAPPPARPYPGDLAAFAGTWTGVGRGQPAVVRIAVADGGLTMQSGNGPVVPLRWVEGDVFAQGNARLAFEREGGSVVRLRLDQVALVTVMRRQQ